MNIFVLDLNIDKCVEYYVDKHSIKMCLEYAQLLCGVHHMLGSENIPYRLSHKNHPSSMWIRECYENYVWLCNLALKVCKEYTFRYNKIHKSQQVVEWALNNVPNLPKNGKITTFPLVMPDDCKVGNTVSSYREYYIKYKKNIASWKKRSVPEWFF